MKFKNITIVEQHVEKLVLALCIIFAIFIIWKFVLATSHTVRMGGRSIPASQIDQQLLDAAQMLEQRLNQSVPSQLTQVRIPPYDDLFAQQLNQPLTPGDVDQLQLPTFGATEIVYSNLVIGAGSTTSQSSFRPLEIPAPDVPVVSPQMGTLDQPLPDDLLQQAQLQPPYDIGWVSLALRLNISQIIRQSEPTPGLDAQPIPLAWMRENLAIADVQIQRQTLLDNGTWSEPQLVPLLPDQPSYRDLIDSDQPLRDWRPLLDDIRLAQPAIVTPQFYNLRNAVWTPPVLPPSEAEVAAEEGSGPSDPATLRRQLTTLQTRLQQYQNRPSSASNERIIQQTQLQIQQLTQRIQQAGGSIENLDAPPTDFFMPDMGGRGGTPSRDPGAPTSPNAPPVQLGPRPESFTGAILSLDQLEMWAIDLDIQPGQTLRYRARVVTTNPLFSRSLSKEQDKIESQFFIFGQWSDWSQPIQTLRNRYFFVVDGSSDQSASVELWRFSEGQWLKSLSRISPGDPIGGLSTSYQPLAGTTAATALQDSLPPADFSTGYITVDLDSYKIAPTGVNTDTLRLLYDDNGRLASRLELYDVQLRDDLKLTLFPELVEERQMTMRERREAYKQRADAAQQRAQSAAGSSSSRSTSSGRGGGGPPSGTR